MSLAPNEFYIPREKIIQAISAGLTGQGIVLLHGDAGTGKTFLAKDYQRLNPLNFTYIQYIDAYTIDFAENEPPPLQFRRPGPDKLLIIDAFDEIISDVGRKNVQRLVNEARKVGIRILITSRPVGIPASIFNNISSIEVDRLMPQEISAFFVQFIAYSGYSVKTISDLIDSGHPILTSPLGLLSAVELIKRYDIDSRELIRLLNEKIQYQAPALILPEHKLASLTPPKLITDIGVINRSLIDIVRKDLNAVHKISPRQFEELVAELFEKDGYKVTLTKQTKDGGKDLFVIEERRIGKFIYYVECKQFAPNRPVGVHLIRELYGTIVAERATAGVVVTSSYFSPDAKTFTDSIKSQMSLIDFIDLSTWINEIKNNA